MFREKSNFFLFPLAQKRSSRERELRGRVRDYRLVLASGIRYAEATTPMVFLLIRVMLPVIMHPPTSAPTLNDKG